MAELDGLRQVERPPGDSGSQAVIGRTQDYKAQLVLSDPSAGGPRGNVGLNLQTATPQL